MNVIVPLAWMLLGALVLLVFQRAIGPGVFNLKLRRRQGDRRERQSERPMTLTSAQSTAIVPDPTRTVGSKRAGRSQPVSESNQAGGRVGLPAGSVRDVCNLSNRQSESDPSPENGEENFEFNGSRFSLIENDDSWLLVRLTGVGSAYLGSAPLEVDDVRAVSRRARLLSVQQPDGEIHVHELPDRLMPKLRAVSGISFLESGGSSEGEWMVVTDSPLLAAVWVDRHLVMSARVEISSFLAGAMQFASPGRPLAVTCEFVAERLRRDFGVHNIFMGVADEQKQLWVASTRGEIALSIDIGFDTHSGAALVVESPERIWSTSLTDLWRWDAEQNEMWVDLGGRHVGHIDLDVEA